MSAPSLASRVAQQRLDRHAAPPSEFAYHGLTGLRPSISSVPLASDCLADLLKCAPYRVVNASHPDGARWLATNLRMPSDAFYKIKQEDERACILSFDEYEDPSGFADTVVWIEPLVGAETGRSTSSLTLRSLCMRIGSATRLGALVAILFDAGRDGEVVVAFSIPQNLLRAYYDGLSKLLRSKAGLEAQVYRTPVQYAQAVEDGFWAGTSKSPPHHGAGRRAGSSSHMAGQGLTDWSDEYAVYRGSIDSLIEGTLREFASALPSHGPVHALEICAGDGSLAERLLLAMGMACGGSFGGGREGNGKGNYSRVVPLGNGRGLDERSIGVPTIASYTCLERNTNLVDQARQRLSKFGPIAEVLQGDATQPKAYREARVAALRAAMAGDEAGASRMVPNLVISSGSVLCGQVASGRGCRDGARRDRQSPARRRAPDRYRIFDQLPPPRTAETGWAGKGVARLASRGSPCSAGGLEADGKARGAAATCACFWTLPVLRAAEDEQGA